MRQKYFKYALLGSLTLFLILYFTPRFLPVLDSFYRLSGYFIPFKFTFINCLLLASFPVLALHFLDVKKNIPLKAYLQVCALFIGSFLLIGFIGIWISICLNNPSSPLLPRYIIEEPFPLFSCLMLLIALLIPFILHKRL